MKNQRRGSLRERDGPKGAGSCESRAERPPKAREVDNKPPMEPVYMPICTDLDKFSPITVANLEGIFSTGKTPRVWFLFFFFFCQLFCVST